jgi:hypothetical protein
VVSKKEHLIEKARATTPKPQPSRLFEDEGKGYRIVSVSLYTPEVSWVDHITNALKRAGNTKANRSYVIQEAIHRLREELEDKNPKEVLTDFIEHHARRVQEA